MTIDPETLMAYADGELDDLAARRVERAIALDPGLAEAVAAHRRLATRLAQGFAPVTDAAMPDRFADLLRSHDTVVALPVPRRSTRWWATGGAIAASLLIGVLGGQAIRPATTVAVNADGLVAAGELSGALDTQLAATRGAGPVKIVATFRDGSGALCRTFADASVTGIACRSSDAWLLRRTASGGTAGAGTEYRQAASIDPAILAAAQDMMAGAPLDAAQERSARDTGWR